MSSDRVSRLAVILHADVVGSTALVTADEQLAHTRIRETFVRLASSSRKYHGQVRELRGDALLAEFERPSDAVCAALAFQAENAAVNIAITDDVKPHVRIGVALGEVVVADKTMTGAGVVLAQRLEQLAAPGTLCISAAIREALPARLPVRCDALGEQHLKGFDEPVRAFIVAPLDDAALPAPAALDRHRSRLGRRRAPMVIVLVTVLCVFAASGIVWLAVPTFRAVVSDRPPSLGTPRLSIAVLPFVNLSGDADQDYFADALTEDLTSDLSRIAGSFVISRGTAATYRGREVDGREVARELNVRYLLEGTVRRAGSKVRVSARLTDGHTAQQVWSERYEKTASDMHVFQQEVTGRVARALNLELKEAASLDASRRAPASLDADDLTQRAWAELWTKPQSRATNRVALDYVSRALAAEPDHPEALGVAAYAYARAANYGWDISRAEGLAKGIAAGERSIALEPDNADVVYSLGFLYYVAGDTKKSLEFMRQCVELNRNHAPAYFFYGINLIRLGRPRDSIEWVERAFALSPRDPLRSVWYSVIARAELLIGEDARAIDAARKGVSTNAKFPQNYAVLASAYALQEKTEDAREALDTYLSHQPKATLASVQRQLAGDDAAAVKAYQRMLEGLRRAGLPE
jgi:TolB-like protein/class 3 adenylate cyclase/Tfp pilus assembly protein PilF